MFGFIRSISFTVQAIIPVLAIVLFGVAWFLPGNLQVGPVYGGGSFYCPTDGWLYSLWLQMGRLPLWAQVVPACLAAIVTAILLVRNDMKNLLMGRRSYAMAYVFLFLLASGGHFFLFHPAFAAGVLMVLSQQFLLDLYKKETEYSYVFGMGFSWGTAVLLYPPALLLVPALLFGMLVMVSTSWRHWTVSIMGLGLPAFLASVTWYLLGDLDYQADTFLYWFRLREPALPSFIVREPFLAAWLGVMITWAVVASVRYRNPKIQSRQLFQSNFLLFVFTILMAILLETVSAEVVWLLVLPMTYLMTFWALEIRKGWVRDLFFLSLLISFVFFRIRGLIF